MPGVPEMPRTWPGQEPGRLLQPAAARMRLASFSGLGVDTISSRQGLPAASRTTTQGLFR